MVPLRKQNPLRRIQEIWPLLPAAIYLLGFLIIVLVYLTGMSLSGPWHETTTFPTLEPLRRIITGPQFRDALVNTLLFVAFGTPLELLTGLCLALMLYKSFTGRAFIRSVFLIPLAIPTLVTATILFILFDFPGGHINDLLMGKYGIFPALIEFPVNWRSTKEFALGISLLGKVWRDTPISMLIICAGLNAIDTELFDAARSMGAGAYRRLRYVILPLILPSISAVVLLRSLEMWKEFVFPFVLAGRYNLLGTLIESLYNNWGKSNEAAGVALVLVGCIVVSTIFLMWILGLVRRRISPQLAK